MIVDIFRDEKYAVKAFNLLLIPDIVRLINNRDPKTIYDDEKDFLNLITILILIPLSFNNKELNVKIYVLIYKLLWPIVDSPDEFSDKLKSEILKCRILYLILKIATYDDTYTVQAFINRVIINFRNIFTSQEASYVSSKLWMILWFSNKPMKNR